MVFAVRLQTTLGFFPSSDALLGGCLQCLQPSGQGRGCL